MTSLNPVFRIGDQVDEVIGLHNAEMSKEQVKARTIEMLDMVGIANKEGVYQMYPHELSGGMRQRIMIAMALACSPRLRGIDHIVNLIPCVKTDFPLHSLSGGPHPRRSRGRFPGRTAKLPERWSRRGTGRTYRNRNM